MITAIMFGIFLIFLGVGVPIAASVGWATLSVNSLIRPLPAMRSTL